MSIRILGVGNSLITGLQGAGKSHFIMSQIKEILDTKQDMKIYLANVDGVTIDNPNLQIVDADFSWVHDAKNNSLIIYDETGTIQRFNNSNRKINSHEEIEKLTMARHQNKTIVFIAQDSSLVHVAIRKLLTRHFHFSNPFNNPKKTHCFVFPQVFDRLDSKDKSWQKKAVDEFEHELNTDIFPLYKSVDDNVEHSKLRQYDKKAKLYIRLAIIFVIIAIPLLFLSLYSAYSYYNKNVKAENVQARIDKNSKIDDKNLGQLVDNKKTEMTKQADITSNVDLQTSHSNRIYARTIEMYQERLPQDYEVLSQNEDLRIASVIMNKSTCVAYNARGEFLNVSEIECRSAHGNMIKSRSTSSLVTSHSASTAQQTN